MIKLVNLKSKYSFYCDENFSFISTGFLRNKGFNVKHASDYGYVNSDSKKFNDERQLKIATKLNRVLLTHQSFFRPRGGVGECCPPASATSEVVHTIGF